MTNNHNHIHSAYIIKIFDQPLWSFLTTQYGELDEKSLHSRSILSLLCPGVLQLWSSREEGAAGVRLRLPIAVETISVVNVFEKRACNLEAIMKMLVAKSMVELVC
jgi:hypothetical protein